MLPRVCAQFAAHNAGGSGNELFSTLTTDNNIKSQGGSTDVSLPAQRVSPETKDNTHWEHAAPRLQEFVTSIDVCLQHALIHKQCAHGLADKHVNLQM